MIIAGSDGLFDNLILAAKPPGAEKFKRPTPPDAKLRACLEQHVRDTLRQCTVDCAVCKAMSGGGGGGRASAMCIGESLQRVADGRHPSHHARPFVVVFRSHFLRDLVNFWR